LSEGKVNQDGDFFFVRGEYLTHLRVMR
jgi:hypothetical protein